MICKYESFRSSILSIELDGGSRTLEHKGSGDKNGANSHKTNKAIYESGNQDNAGKKLVSLRRK